MTIMSQSRIDALNGRAADLLMTAHLDHYDAFQQAARDAGLKYVRSTGDVGSGPQCQVWRDADGALVNLWIVASHPNLLGFDDQVDD